MRRKQAEHANVHASRLELSEALARALSRLSELQQAPTRTLTLARTLARVDLGALKM